MIRPVAAAALAAPLLFAALSAQAQVIERNLPPQASPKGEALAPPNAVATEQDDTPIGPALTGIVLLNATAPADATAVGVDARQAPRMDTARGRNSLARYLGRPLSRKLIAEIEADIARVYRTKGYPFVALSTPAQEVTGGVLQIRVIEFQAGTVTVSGAQRTDPEQLRRQVRQPSGEPIDAPRLSEDLDALNRNPFRQVQALFAPGDALGRSNLTLGVSETKPWRVYAGANNNGTIATGRGRLFAGVQAAPLAVSPDTVFSYQFTGSDDLFGGGRAAYRSHAANASLAIAPRQAIELTVDRVETAQSLNPFGVRQDTDEVILGWRGPGAALGDLRVGVEARRSHRTILFGDTPIIKDRVSIFQVYGGVEKAGTDRLGGYSFSATVHISPGGVGASNSAKALAAFSNGRVIDDRYAYLDGRYARSTRLGGGYVLSTEVIGRLAQAPLPETEQVGVGGATLVRGYTLDDGAFDSAIVVRNTLRTPAVSAFARKVSFDDTLQPYGFVDAGYGRERRTHASATPVSAGAGATLRLTRFAFFQVDVARTLNDTPFTREGTWRAQASTTFSF